VGVGVLAALLLAILADGATGRGELAEPRCPSVASSATAEQAGIISDTLWAHAASDVSPLLNMARQCARHAWPSELHVRAASTSA